MPFWYVLFLFDLHCWKVIYGYLLFVKESETVIIHEDVLN